MKKIIVVCEEKTKKYGNYFSQLVSSNNGNDSITNVDGDIAIQVWTEKQYEDNSAQISSNQNIIFIGNSKSMKQKKENMEIKYFGHGINYSWLGRQAVISCEKELCRYEVERFYDDANKYVTNKKELEVFKTKKSKIINNIPLSIIFIFSLLNPITTLVSLLLLYNWILMNRKTKQQQYIYSIARFYKEDLENFLEGNNKIEIINDFDNLALIKKRSILINTSLTFLFLGAIFAIAAFAFLILGFIFFFFEVFAGALMGATIFSCAFASALLNSAVKKHKKIKY